jgi:hypothetical protein
MFGNENSKVSQSSISSRIENRSIGNSSFRRYGNNGNQNNRYRNNGNSINGNINVVTPGDENEHENGNENENENLHENENEGSEILDEERSFYENEIERLLVRGKKNRCTSLFLPINIFKFSLNLCFQICNYVCVYSLFHRYHYITHTPYITHITYIIFIRVTIEVCVGASNSETDTCTVPCRSAVHAPHYYYCYCYPPSPCSSYGSSPWYCSFFCFNSPSSSLFLYLSHHLLQPYSSTLFHHSLLNSHPYSYSI